MENSRNSVKKYPTKKIDTNKYNTKKQVQCKCSGLCKEKNDVNIIL